MQSNTPSVFIEQQQGDAIASDDLRQKQSNALKNGMEFRSGIGDRHHAERKAVCAVTGNHCSFTLFIIDPAGLRCEPPTLLYRPFNIGTRYEPDIDQSRIDPHAPANLVVLIPEGVEHIAWNH